MIVPAQIAVHLLPICAIVLYGIAGYMYARYLSDRESRIGLLAHVPLALGFFCHASFLFALVIRPLRDTLLGGGAANQEFALGVGALSAVLIGVFLIAQYRLPRLAALGAFLAPVGVLFFLFSSLAFHVDSPGSPGRPNTVLWMHILAALLADLMFALSFVFSAAFLLKERLIRRKRLLPAQGRIPPLEELDRYNSWALSGGLIGMSLGVGLGFVYAVAERVRFVEFDPRLIWSAFVLVVYGLIILLRVSRGIRGRRGAWLAVVAFGLLILSLFGSKLTGGFHVY